MATGQNSHGRRLQELEHVRSAASMEWSAWVEAGGPEAIAERWQQVPRHIAHATALSITTTAATCALASVHRGVATSQIEQRLQCYPEALQEPIRQMVREQWSQWGRARRHE